MNRLSCIRLCHVAGSYLMTAARLGTVRGWIRDNLFHYAERDQREGSEDESRAPDRNIGIDCELGGQFDSPGNRDACTDPIQRQCPLFCSVLCSIWYVYGIQATGILHREKPPTEKEVPFVGANAGPQPLAEGRLFATAFLQTTKF